MIYFLNEIIEYVITNEELPDFEKNNSNSNYRLSMRLPFIFMYCHLLMLTGVVVMLLQESFSNNFCYMIG